VIREPLGGGYGNWVGGHKISHDPVSGTFAVFYRMRTPLEQGRGAECAVAVSTNGVEFEDVWTTTKDDSRPIRSRSGIPCGILPGNGASTSLMSSSTPASGESM
jgi:hypothetical protein